MYIGIPTMLAVGKVEIVRCLNYGKFKHKSLMNMFCLNYGKFEHTILMNMICVINKDIIFHALS